MDESIVDVSTQVNNEGLSVSNIVNKEETSSGSRWVLGSYNVPKEEIVFFSQLSIITLVVLVGLINLCLNNGTESYWAAMVATGLGALLPAPNIKKRAKAYEG